MLVPFDTKNSALLMVDIQEHLMPLVSGKDAVLRNAVRLLTAVRVLDLPLLVTEQYPKGIGPTLLQLSSLLPPGTPCIEKTSFSCCGHAGFDEALDALDRPVTVLFGIETHICILSTVMDLIGRGRSVVLVADACGSRDAANHALAVDAARACGAFVVPTETVVYRMLGNSRAPGFKALLPLFK